MLFGRSIETLHKCGGISAGGNLDANPSLAAQLPSSHIPPTETHKEVNPMEHGPRVRGARDGETSGGINWFELFAALILGASGISTALVSFEAELWTGKMSQLYTQANQLSTEAAAEKSRAVVQIA